MLRKIIIFMVVMILAGGVVYAAPADLPKTGQTTSYATGDDGALQVGVAWPSPRFTDNLNGTVTDNLTGLMWVKAPDSTTRTWANALAYANTLTLCGYDDWRLPNRKELRSLINYGEADTAAWLNTQGFSNVQAGFYWSSTTYAGYTVDAWGVHMWYGIVCTPSIRTIATTFGLYAPDSLGHSIIWIFQNLAVALGR